jgi:hypothetical protein
MELTDVVKGISKAYKIHLVLRTYSEVHRTIKAYCNYHYKIHLITDHKSKLFFEFSNMDRNNDSAHLKSDILFITSLIEKLNNNGVQQISDTSE